MCRGVPGESRPLTFLLNQGSNDDFCQEGPVEAVRKVHKLDGPRSSGVSGGDRGLSGTRRQLFQAEPMSPGLLPSGITFIFRNLKKS